VTSMTDGAKIIPFRPRTTVPDAIPVGQQCYVVSGRYERHKRSFNVWGYDLQDAADGAQSLIDWYAHNSSGTYGPLVWQRGEIVLTHSYDTSISMPLRPCPVALVKAATPKTTKRKKQ